MEIFNMNIMTILCYLLYLGLFGLVILIKEYERKIKLEKIKSSDFLPEDEISYLKQIFLLLFGLLSLIGLIFSFIIKDYVNYFELACLNIIFTTVAIIYLAEKSYTKLILSVLIIPSTSIIWLLFNKDLPNFFLMIQCIGNLITGLYFIYKFFKYTKNNDTPARIEHMNMAYIKARAYCDLNGIKIYNVHGLPWHDESIISIVKE